MSDLQQVLEELYTFESLTHLSDSASVVLHDIIRDFRDALAHEHEHDDIGGEG